MEVVELGDHGAGEREVVDAEDVEGLANWARKVAVGVRVPSQPQRSLAPMRMVTYWATWPTVVRAWPGASAISAPADQLWLGQLP